LGSTPQRGHHLRRKFLYGGVAAALALNVLLFTNRHHTPKGYILRVASDTCYCYPFNRIINWSPTELEQEVIPKLCSPADAIGPFTSTERPA
jgi:hypothetical protein